MASVTKTRNKKKIKAPTPVRTGLCLKGSINGKVVFRVTNCRRERLRVRRRPYRKWIDAGWLSENLLDE